MSTDLRLNCNSLRIEGCGWFFFESAMAYFQHHEQARRIYKTTATSTVAIDLTRGPSAQTKAP